MCGIFGVFGRDPLDKETLENSKKSIKKIENRGPDKSGVVNIDDVFLGHTRLAIQDLNSTGDQPMWDRSQRYVIVFNGEIYNFLKLRKILTNAKITLRGTSDTEVLINLFALLGAKCFQLLNGIFALAIYDRIEKKMYLARDRFGVKPLFYQCLKNRLIFASHLDCFDAFSYKSINRSAVCDFLFFSSPLKDETFFSGIKSLEKNTYAVISGGEVKYKKQIPKMNEISKKNNFNELFSDVMKQQTLSDVKLTCLFSGGLDSLAIAHYMYTNKVDSDFIFANFEGKNKEDLFYAMELNKKIGFELEVINISISDLTNQIKNVYASHGQPFGDPASLALMALYENISEKVVLQGDGGDETFLGYDRYWSPKPTRTTSFIAGYLDRLLGGRTSLGRYAKIYASSDNMKFLFNASSQVSHHPKVRSLYDFEKIQSTFERFCESAAGAESLNQIDFEVLLPFTYLPKVDRASMFYGVEARVPFLDNLFFTSRFSEKRNSQLSAKQLIKDSLVKIYGSKLVNRKKSGFSVPIDLVVKANKEFLLDTLENNYLLEVCDKKIVRKFLEYFFNSTRHSYLNHHLVYKFMMMGHLR